jgi:hypothetical protein
MEAPPEEKTESIPATAQLITRNNFGAKVASRPCAQKDASLLRG